MKIITLKYLKKAKKKKKMQLLKSGRYQKPWRLEGRRSRVKKDPRQERRKYASNTKITNAPVSEADQAEQEVVGSGVAEVSTRNLYFILQSDTPGECALFISIIEDDTTMVLQKGMKWEESEVVQPCPTVCDPMGCSPPGSFIHGILPARVLE